MRMTRTALRIAPMPRPMPIPNAMALLRVECEDMGVPVGEDSVAVGWDIDFTDKMLRSVVALGTIFSTSSTTLRWGFTRSNFPLLIVSLLRLFSLEECNFASISEICRAKDREDCYGLDLA